MASQATEFQSGIGPSPGHTPVSPAQPADPAGEPSQLFKTGSETASSNNGGNISSQESASFQAMESQTNMLTLTESEANSVVVGVGDSRVQGSIFFTQDWCVLNHNRHTVSSGVQVKAPIIERGIQKPRLFFTVDVSLAAQTYSPSLADGMGGSQKGEFHCCGYGVQYRHTKISTIDEEGYRCHRLALTQLPFRSKNIPALQGSTVQPYLFYSENQGFTGGVNFEPLQSSYQLSDTGYFGGVEIPLDFTVGGRIGGRGVDSRKTAHAFNPGSPTREARDLNEELVNQNIDESFYQGIQTGNPPTLKSKQVGQNMLIASILGVALVSVLVFLPPLKVLKSRIVEAVKKKKRKW